MQAREHNSRIMNWHIFCHVIDNLGDAGVCWRLAAALVRGGYDRVTLWIDQPQALDGLCPPVQRPAAIEVRRWQPGDDASARLSDAAEAPDVLIEAFGCYIPQQYQADVAIHKPGTAWINLEYLSAESYVKRSHGLPSPVMSGPAKGLTKWFFYPGFEPGTGGLLIGDAPALCEARTPAEALVFSYETQALHAACEGLIASGVRPVLAGGRTQAWMREHAPELLPACRIAAFEPQTGFDALLAGSRINIVRGEDSFVRAQLAGRPFVWHIYPQDDGAHWPKLQAFMDLYCTNLTAPAADALAQAWLGFNRGTLTAEQWQGFLEQWPKLQAHAQEWRAKLLAVDCRDGAAGDLSANLRAFALSKLAPRPDEPLQ